MAETRYKKPQPKPLVPHVEYNDYGMAVVIVRIPQGTHRQIVDKVMEKARQMAKAESSWSVW